MKPLRVPKWLQDGVFNAFQFQGISTREEWLASFHLIETRVKARDPATGEKTNFTRFAKPGSPFALSAGSAALVVATKTSIEALRDSASPLWDWIAEEFEALVANEEAEGQDDDAC